MSIIIALNKQEVIELPTLFCQLVHMYTNTMFTFCSPANTSFIPAKVEVYQALSCDVCLAETWTVLDSDIKTVEPLHMKCQWQILQDKWWQFVLKNEFTATTSRPSR